MSEKPTDGVSRRSILKTTSFGIAGVPVIGSLADTAAASDTFPYDKIKNNEHSTTIRYTKNALWHNKIKIGVSSTLNHIGSKGTRDDRWNHKFGINTQAVAYHTDAEELRANIRNHSVKGRKLGGDKSSLELDGRPVGSNFVGATPASDSAEDLEEIFSTSLRATAGLLNAKFAVASAAESIASSLKEAGSQTCKESADCLEYEWTYLQDKEEVSHQAKWWVTTGKEEWGNVEVATQADSETAISFILSVGPDHGDIAPGDPPSKTGGDVKTADSHPHYMTREELNNLTNSGRLTDSGIPGPETMDAETAEKYNVQKVDSPETIVVGGEEKEVTHEATNLPIQILGLEPKKKNLE